MIEVGVFEANNTLGALLERVERGEVIVITRHGKPVARLVGNTGWYDREEAKAAADRIQDRAAGLSGQGYAWDPLKADRDEGRP